ncbi:hypothetical protein [Streptomyces sp. KL118A]|uniref:hypothetical protein n=1 Tax=Streptomyces sp. KL118A TaxID=3045153 RepID=UPI00278BEF96|nr:hypothetical protein [Streptomyces sp. KL118A]
MERDELECLLLLAEALRVSHPGLAVEVCEVPLGDPYGQLRKGEFDVQLTEFPVRGGDLADVPLLTITGPAPDHWLDHHVPFADAEPTGYGLVWRLGHETGAVAAFARTAREVTGGRMTAGQVTA